MEKRVDLTKVLKYGQHVYFAPTGTLARVISIGNDGSTMPIVLELEINKPDGMGTHVIKPHVGKYGELHPEMPTSETMIFPSRTEREWVLPLGVGDLAIFWDDEDDRMLSVGLYGGTDEDNETYPHVLNHIDATTGGLMPVPGTQGDNFKNARKFDYEEFRERLEKLKRIDTEPQLKTDKTIEDEQQTDNTDQPASSGHI